MHNFVKAIIVCCLLIIIGGCVYYTQQKGQGLREEEDQGETNPVSDLQGYTAYDPYTSAYDRGVGQGGGLDRKTGGGSLRDNPPTEPGCHDNCPEFFQVLSNANFGKLKGRWISWSGKPIHGYVWDENTNTGIALVHDGYWIKMAKFNSDGNPISNSGRYYSSYHALMTDTITSLYKKGYNARNNYKFVKGCGFCLKKKSDPGCALDKAAHVATQDKLTEEIDMFDVSFNYFKNEFRFKDRLYQDCIATASGDSASFITNLENERRKFDISINKITEERDDLKARNKEMEEELRKKDNLINTMSNDLMEAQEYGENQSTKLENTENQLIQTENELDVAWDTMGEYSPVIVQ